MKLRILLISVAAGMLVGCGSLTETVTEPRVVEIPVSTNFVEKAVTDEQGNVRVVSVPEIITQLRTNEVVVDVQPKQSVLDRIEAARSANAIFNPTRSAPLVNMGLGLFGAAVTAFAGYQRRKLKGELSGRETAERVLASVTRGVEEFSRDPKQKSVKEAIQARAGSDGTEPDLKAFLAAA